MVLSACEGNSGHGSIVSIGSRHRIIPGNVRGEEQDRETVQGAEGEDKKVLQQHKLEDS